MDKTYIVADQSILREINAGFFESNPNIIIVIPDVGLMEMCKSNLWKTTMFRSLKGLSNYPTRCNITIGIGEAIRYETRTRLSIDGKWFNKEMTRFFRKLLTEIAQSKDGEITHKMEKDMANIQDKLRNNELNDAENKKRLSSQIDLLKDMITPDNLKALRAKRVNLQDKLDDVKKAAPIFLSEYLRQAGFPANMIGHFLKQTPALLRLTYLRIWLELNWLEQDGFDNVKPEKITNYYMDHDYILTATFFDDFLSRDKDAKSTYDAISKIINSGKQKRNSHGVESPLGSC
jgi:hypothetical protein